MSNRKSFFRTVLDRMIAARQRQAEMEIAHYRDLHEPSPRDTKR